MAVVATLENLARLHPNESPANLRRLSSELHVEALYEAMQKTTDDARREAMTKEYCRIITQSYATNHTASDPAAASLFLATRDYSPCN